MRSACNERKVLVLFFFILLAPFYHCFYGSCACHPMDCHDTRIKINCEIVQWDRQSPYRPVEVAEVRRQWLLALVVTLVE